MGPETFQDALSAAGEGRQVPWEMQITPTWEYFLL